MVPGTRPSGDVADGFFAANCHHLQHSHQGLREGTAIAAGTRPHGDDADGSFANGKLTNTESELKRSRAITADFKGSLDLLRQQLQATGAEPEAEVQASTEQLRGTQAELPDRGQDRWA